MEKTVIYLVRHGQSIGNLRHEMLGHTDLELSELGFEQAEACGRELASINFDAIYASDLKRAMSTAAPHARLRNMDVTPDKELRELYIGEWEGKSVVDIIEQYGDLFKVNWREHFATFQSPSGESVPELCNRIYYELERIAKAHTGKTVLAVFHAAAIRCFWARISGIAPDEVNDENLPFPTNASYSVIEYCDGAFTPVSYSNEPRDMASSSFFNG